MGAGARPSAGPLEGRRRTSHPPDAAPFHAGDVVAGRYRVVGAVGAGPLGWVFLARDRQGDTELALKVIRPHLAQTPAERQHLVDTLQRGRRVGHAGVVAMLDVGEEAGLPFFTQPFLDGMPLRRILERRLSRGQRFTLEEVEPMLGQLARALDAAHRVGPHGGVKPENVFVLPAGIRLTDYALGPALPLQPFVQAQRQARADAYLAPELHEGAPDARSDVYALGVLLGELLTGQRPGEGGVPELTRLNPSLPRAVDGLYRQALALNPLARPRTAGELVAGLSALVGRPSAPQPRAAPPPVPDDEEEDTLSMPPPEGWGAATAATSWPPPPVPDVLPARPGPRESARALPFTAELPVPSLEEPSSGEEALVAQALKEPGAAWSAAPKRGRTEVLEAPLSAEGPPLAQRLLAPLVAAGTVVRGLPRPYLWLVLLALVGVAAGAAVGMWLLHRLPSTPSVIPLPPDAAPRPT